MSIPKLWATSFPVQGEDYIAITEDGEEVNCGPVRAWRPVTIYYWPKEVGRPIPGFRVRTKSFCRDFRVYPLEEEDGIILGDIPLPIGSYGQPVYEPPFDLFDFGYRSRIKLDPLLTA